ncbi:MAG: hypothetical protein ACTHXO_01285 [Actinomycetaceae bacterium]
MAAAMLSACGDAEESSSAPSDGDVDRESISASPSESSSGEEAPLPYPPPDDVEVGGTYRIDDATVVQREGDRMEVTFTVAEGSSDGMPANWDPPILVLTFEDGMSADDFGITRVSSGWIDSGDITFRVTDLDTDPTTAVLLSFDPS